MSNYGEHEIIEWGELKTMKKKLHDIFMNIHSYVLHIYVLCFQKDKSEIRINVKNIFSKFLGDSTEICP